MSLEGHAEVMKLARLLDTPAERLAYLERLDPADVRALRERATAHFHEADRRLGRVALAARIPPVAVTTWIAQHLFGPLLCARVAGLLELRRAVDIAKRLPTEFLADLAMELDPRRARDIIFALPPQLIGQVADVLTQRERAHRDGPLRRPHDRRRAARGFAVIPDAHPAADLLLRRGEGPARPRREAARHRPRERGDPLGERRGPLAAGARPADARDARARRLRSRTSPPTRRTTCSTAWCSPPSATGCGTSCCR